jgi:putative nucleotidyltransferase with HDIG domain
MTPSSQTQSMHMETAEMPEGDLAEKIPIHGDEEAVVNLTALIKKVKDLPPMPAIVVKAMEMSLDPNTSVRNLQMVISQDQALSAIILRIVNSAMYALRAEVSTVSHAVAVLGIETVRSVIMAASVEQVFQGANSLGTKLLTEHSWGTALAARSIARRVGYKNIEEALISGLMHDIGKPVMVQNLRDPYNEILNEVYKGYSSFHQLELSTFGFSHAHVGALLARKWNFPPQLAEAVGYHHNPLSAPEYKQLACIVNLANLLMIHVGIGFEKDKNLLLDKQPAAAHLNLSGSVFEELTAEVQMTIKNTSALRG